MNADEEQLFDEALETMWEIERRNGHLPLIGDWPAEDQREWRACFDLRREVKVKELKR